MALALMVGILTTTADAHVRQIPKRCRTALAPRLCAIHHHVRATNRLRHKMGQHAIPYHWVAEGHPKRRPRILVYWTKTHRHTLRRYRRVLSTRSSSPWSGSWYRAALCVHHYEGAWDSNTGNGYYGGMQFSLSSWAANGGSGRPDLASPHDQLLVAYHYWRAAGWGPWPNTARMCGLL